MELALGTVQFGLAYGIRGNSRPPADSDVRKMLELASQGGIATLDTAPAYGDIETRLGRLCDGLEFEIVSKIPSVPDSLAPAEAGRWAVESARTSLERLGSRLRTLLFHRVEDLQGDRGSAIWGSVFEWTKNQHVNLGISGYEFDSVLPLAEKFPIATVQLPGNAFDQRAARGFANSTARPLLHLRSVYLQGLLVLPLDMAVKALPSATPILAKWHSWLAVRGLSPIQGALSVAKSFEGVAACVVGVDNMFQLQELLQTWSRVYAIAASELASSDVQLIDPRLWVTREGN